MKLFSKIFLFCTALLFTAGFAFAQDNVNWQTVKVLVYTKNGKGYVHDNISSAILSLQKLGNHYGFAVDTSAEP